MNYGFDFESNTVYELNKPKKSYKKVLVLSIVLLSLAIFLFLGCLGVLFLNTATDFQDTVYYVSSRDVLLNNGEKASLADTIEMVEKSVVAIGSTEEAGNGSGVILTPDGFILTNNHVVTGQTSVYVCLYNGKVYEGIVHATDEKSDIAVVKIDAEDELVPALIGDSDKIRNGDSVFVIGNPTGSLKGSVSSGIVSYEKRIYTVEGLTMELVQIDAAVNGGNSGGGLFNEYGELIGIVNAKIAGLAVESLGFAIPSNTAINVAEQLIEQKYVSGRPYIGISYEARPIYSYMGYTYKFVITESEYCEDLKAGDEIISIAGKSLLEYSSQQVLYGYEVGDNIEIVVSRNGKTIIVNMTLREYKPKN